MKLAHVAVGIVLASTVAACTGSASSGTSSTPATKTVADWVVLWENTSRDNGVTTYSVTCRNHSVGWREVTVPPSKGYAYNQGDPCPSGPILGASGCDRYAQPINATDPTADAEGVGICPRLQQEVSE